MPWPSTLTSFTDPNPSNRLNNPSHSSIETAQNTGLEELQAFIGVNTGATASAVGTLLYDVKAPGSNGGGHIQTANKGGTGQTAYTKGDLLVASSSSVLARLAVGSNGNVLKVNSGTTAGLAWGGGGSREVIASTQTWSIPSNATAIFVQIWGGGGGGGGSGAGAGTTCGGGGGGGAYAEGWFAPSLLGTSQLTIVGLGGSGGVGNNPGSVGGVTVFGAASLLSAFGGGGGFGASANNSNGGGGGGGTLSPGATPTGSVFGGQGGRPYPGNALSIPGNGGQGGDGSMGGAQGNGRDSGTQAGYSGYGGGGGGGGTQNSNNARGGNSAFGGGGGAGGTTATGASTLGGVSYIGGYGGNSTPNSSGNPGSVRGGGGAGSHSSDAAARNGGDGGRGEIAITVF